MVSNLRLDLLLLLDFGVFNDWIARSLLLLSTKLRALHAQEEARVHRRQWNVLMGRTVHAASVIEDLVLTWVEAMTMIIVVIDDVELILVVIFHWGSRLKELFVLVINRPDLKRAIVARTLLTWFHHREWLW